MVYERNFDLLNGKFRELFFPTLFTSIAGNFAVLIDAFFISMFIIAHVSSSCPRVLCRAPQGPTRHR